MSRRHWHIQIIIVAVTLLKSSSGFVASRSPCPNHGVWTRGIAETPQSKQFFASTEDKDEWRKYSLQPKTNDCKLERWNNNFLEGSCNPPNVRRRDALSFLVITLSTMHTWSSPVSKTFALADDRTIPNSNKNENENDKNTPVARNPVSEEPMECRNGGIVSESAVPGAYSQSCMSLSERSFYLKSTGDNVVINQGTNAAGGMAGRTGVAVWNSGILLFRLLDGLNKSFPSESPIFKGKTVVELGCGTGLNSIVAAKLGAASVYATDNNPEVLSLAQRNIERNNLSNVVKTSDLKWGMMDASEFENTADVVIGSDLTYNSGSWLSLGETMATILKPGGTVIYLTLGHSGFNVGGEMGGFLSVVENAGLQLLKKGCREWMEWGETALVASAILQMSTSPEERSVIDANGGYRITFLVRKKF